MLHNLVSAAEAEELRALGVAKGMEIEVVEGEKLGEYATAIDKA